MCGGFQVTGFLLPRGNWAYWPVAALKVHTEQAGFGASDAYRPERRIHDGIPDMGWCRRLAWHCARLLRLNHHLHGLIFGKLTLKPRASLGQRKAVGHELLELDFACAQEFDSLGKLIAVAERAQEFYFTPYQAA